MTDSEGYAGDIAWLEKKIRDEYFKKYPKACMDGHEYLAITITACTAVLARTIDRAVAEIDKTITGSIP